METISEDQYTYYYFLLTLSRLFEKEEEGYLQYDGWHLSSDSMYSDLADAYLRKVRMYIVG